MQYLPLLSPILINTSGIRPFLEENKKVIGREGAIPPLVLLLRSNVDKIQRNSAVTLKNLSTNNGTSFY